METENIFLNKYVAYFCSCGVERPLSKVYFCRYCSELRCGNCVSHEVDSHYCQNCLEYMPSQEARLKKNKCANCFDCPCCTHTLSTRATSIQMPSVEDPEKLVPKKVYYLVCGFCRWTSRDVGIPDQTTASGGWQEKENPKRQDIYALMEHYRMLAHKEKLEKERKKLSQRCSYLHFSDRYGVSATVQRRLAGATMTALSTKDEKTSEKLILPEATTEAEPLPQKYLTEPINLSSVTTLKQRLLQPQFQPASASELFPQQKYLSIKRSQRCKGCDHNLSKPEYNPSSIKFKIQLAAFYHIPNLQIKLISPLVIGENCKIELTICNPTQHVANISFSPLKEVSDKYSIISVPSCVFVLPAKDDTAEYDDVGDTNSYNDDPKIVLCRKANKLTFVASVIPKETGNVEVSFLMKHDFVNTVVQLQSEQREPNTIWLTHKLALKLGPVSGR